MSLIGNILGTISGGKELKVSENLLFDKVIGFRGVVEGVGVSTLVQNVAVALADSTNNTVCVVDTSILAPSQEYLLGLENEDNYKKDLLDFTAGQLSNVVYKTRFTNVYLTSYHNRELPDLLSSKECQRTISDFFEELKSFFDVVLVDLSHEVSWAVAESAIRCNRIYTVMTPSITCLSLLQRSLNEAASLAVPLHKMRKVIINKNVSDVNAGVESALKEYGLQLMATVPLSDDIARMGVTGERIWGSFSGSRYVTAYNKMLDVLLADILERNDLNQKQMRANLLGAAVEDESLRPVNIMGEDFETGEKKKTGFFGRKKAKRASEEVDMAYEEPAPAPAPAPVPEQNSTLNLEKPVNDTQDNTPNQYAQQPMRGMRNPMGSQAPMQDTMNTQPTQQPSMQNAMGMQGGQRPMRMRRPMGGNNNNQ